MFARLRRWFGDTGTWLRAEPVRMAVVGVGLAVGAGAGVPSGQRMFDYTWRDSRFCDDCHVHDYANEAWARSVHADLTTCHDCHRVPISHYPRNLWVTAVDPPQTREDIHAPHIPVVVCGQCHLQEEEHHPLTGPMPEEIRAKVVKIEGSPLHSAHLEAKSRTPSSYQGGDAAKPAEPAAHGEQGDTIDCMACHGSPTAPAHQFEASTETCVECHSALSPASHGPGALPCLQCHITGFLVEPP